MCKKCLAMNRINRRRLDKAKARVNKRKVTVETEQKLPLIDFRKKYKYKSGTEILKLDFVSWAGRLSIRSDLGNFITPKLHDDFGKCFEFPYDRRLSNYDLIEVTDV